MKNKFIKTVSLWICCIMVSTVISVSTLGTHTILITTAPAHETVMHTMMDPPF